MCSRLVISLSTWPTKKLLCVMDCTATEQAATLTRCRFVKNDRRSLDQMGGPGHPLYSIAVQCLSDTPDQRPTSRDLVRRMEQLCENQPLPYKSTLQTITELTELAELRANELEVCTACACTNELNQSSATNQTIFFVKVKTGKTMIFVMAFLAHPKLLW